jgi:CrcB protein
VKSEVNVEEIDPGIDRPAGPRRPVRHHGPVLGVVAVGGGLGTLARYGISRLLPAAPDGFPWATFLINVLGCLLIGVLMVLVTEVYAAHRLVRPFLGVGVLGGFTTFSTYALEIHELLRPGTIGVAFGYLAGTLVAAMLAVLAGTWLTRALVGRPA